jgi:broad specificity phosphatase PhoE
VTVFYLARHGQTEWNVAGRRQGRLDSPLTPLGRVQAERNAVLLAGHGFDAVFSSPLGRAHSTARVLARDSPVQLLEDLSEVDHGLWSGLTSAEIDAGWPEARKERARDKYAFRFPQGESYADAEVRAGRALAVVRESGAERALVVSHEMVGRMLLRQLGVVDALSLAQPSDVVYRVPGDGSYERLVGAE